MGAALSQAPDLAATLTSVWQELDPGLDQVLPKSSLKPLLQKVIKKAKLSLELSAVLEVCERELTGEQISKVELEALYYRQKGGSGATDLSAIRRQVEYYLSDTNLKNDKFFHDLIAKTEGGYLPMEVLLKCNKLKKLTQSPALVADAVSTSGELELNSDRTALRRVGNRPPPPLGAVKKAASQAAAAAGTEPTTERSKPEPTTLILKFSLPEESKATWKDLRDAYRAKYPEKELWYVRLHDGEGHIGLPGNLEAEVVRVLKVEGLVIAEHTVKFVGIEGDELLQFWKDHGSHYDMCNQQGKRRKEKTRSQLRFGGKNFQSSAKVKTYLKSLLSATKEGSEVDPQYHNFLVDILKLHPEFATKSKDLKNFAVGRHPDHPESKCFFIVRTDGNKEDFSIAKCLAAI